MIYKYKHIQFTYRYTVYIYIYPPLLYPIFHSCESRDQRDKEMSYNVVEEPANAGTSREAMLTTSPEGLKRMEDGSSSEEILAPQEMPRRFKVREGVVKKVIWMWCYASVNVIGLR